MTLCTLELDLWKEILIFIPANRFSRPWCKLKTVCSSWNRILSSLKQPQLFEVVDYTDFNVPTSLIGYLYGVKYGDLVKCFGEPIDSGNQGDLGGCKSYVNWNIKFHDDDNTVATIYDYKVGKCYLGEEGVSLDEINDWHVGGKVNIFLSSFYESSNKYSTGGQFDAFCLIRACLFGKCEKHCINKDHTIGFHPVLTPMMDSITV